MKNQIEQLKRENLANEELFLKKEKKIQSELSKLKEQLRTCVERQS